MFAIVTRKNQHRRGILMGLVALVFALAFVLPLASTAWSQKIKTGDLAELKKQILKREKAEAEARALSNEPEPEPLYWYDGDERRTVFVDNRYYAIFRSGDSVKERTQPPSLGQGEEVVVSNAFVSIVKKGNSEAQTQSTYDDSHDLVFSNQYGQLLALPGGVLLFFNKNITDAEIERFFVSKNIPSSQYKKNPDMRNFYVVETEPGLPSLELANKLKLSPELFISSPNWWQKYELH